MSAAEDAAAEYRKYLISSLKSDIAMLKRLDGQVVASPGTSQVSRLLRREQDIISYARLKHSFEAFEKGDLGNCVQGMFLLLHTKRRAPK